MREEYKCIGEKLSKSIRLQSNGLKTIVNIVEVLLNPVVKRSDQLFIPKLEREKC
jgi:hypothetical protein